MKRQRARQDVRKVGEERLPHVETVWESPNFALFPSSFRNGTSLSLCSPLCPLLSFGLELLWEG